MSNQQPKSSISLIQRIVRVLGTRLFFGVAIIFVALLSFGWLVYQIREGNTIGFDNAVRESIHTFDSPNLTLFMKAMSRFGSRVVMTPISICVAVIFLFWKRRAFVFFMLTILGATILDPTLKAAFQRGRPEPFFDMPLFTTYSFPSGHALFALCFFCALAWLFTPQINSLALQIMIWFLAGLLIFLIGFSRIYLGLHYPSDVIGGYAAGLVWFSAVALSDLWLYQQSTAKNNNAV